MSKRLLPESFIPSVREWVPGHTDHELAMYLTELTGSPFDRKRAKNFRRRNGIPLGKKAKRPRYLYSDSFISEVREWTPGHTDHELAEYLDEHTERSWSRSQAKNFRVQHGIPLGKPIPGGGRFVKGQESWCKGRKLGTRGRAAETQFKKGNRPHNAAEIGARRKAFMTDGSYYWKEKIAEPNQWEFCHRIIWEANNGKIPENHVIVFLDRNRDNLSIDNLSCISKSELYYMNSEGLWSEDKEITETAINISRVKSAAYKRRKEKKT